MKKDVHSEELIEEIQRRVAYLIWTSDISDEDKELIATKVLKMIEEGKVGEG